MIRFRNSNYRWDDFHVAVVADLLSHPARIRVIRYLLETENGTKARFVKINRLNPELMQTHLDELVHGEFLIRTGEAGNETYRLNREKWAYCRKILFELLNYRWEETEQKDLV